MKSTLKSLLLAAVSLLLVTIPAAADGVCEPNQANRAQMWCRLHHKKPTTRALAHADLTLYLYPVDRQGRYRRFFLRSVNGKEAWNGPNERKIIDCFDRVIYNRDLNNIEEEFMVRDKVLGGKGENAAMAGAFEKVADEIHQIVCLNQNFMVFEAPWPVPPSFTPF